VDKLATTYFKKFRVRVEVLPEYKIRNDYSDVIREGQEALEIFLKGLLRVIGISPTHTHDPGKELKELRDKIPHEFSNMTDDLIRWSRNLRKDRELSFYGARDFDPDEEYTEEDAQEVIDFLNKVKKALEKYLKTV
jgi:HEPN domain-containing protein